MNKSSIVLYVFITCLTGLSTLAKGQAKPNIILILADDLGYADLGCYGQRTLKTPNIDKLASDGIKMTQFYAGSSVCAPSRCALLTGKHVGNCSVRGNQPKGQLIKDAEATVPELLKGAGYYTGIIGKWGMGNAPEPDDPKNNGFDYHYGYVNMWHAHNFYPEFLYRNGQKVMLDNVTGSTPKGDYPEGVGYASVRKSYAPDLFEKDALSFIQTNKSKPFFLFYAINTPHGNSEYKTDGNGMEVPDTKAFDHEKWPNAEKGFAEMMRKLDITVGRIVEKVKAEGLENNTIIIFSSDNGPHNECNHDAEFFNSNGQLRGSKRDMYEGGIRVPFIAKYPGHINAGTTSDIRFAFWDILPTIAELVGLPKDNIVKERISFLPTLYGKSKQKKHKNLYWEFYEENGKQAVIWKDWKGVRLNTNNPKETKLELYDLANDISEKNDVSASHKQVVDKIMQIMKKEHSPFALTSLFENDSKAQRDVQSKK